MIEIEWTNFAIVAGVVLLASVLLPLFYSGGVRLLETSGTTNVAARAGAYACFAVCIGAVLLGLWVIIPQFHA